MYQTVDLVCETKLPQVRRATTSRCRYVNMLPTKRKEEKANAGHGDIIIPRGIENHVAINMVSMHVQRMLQEKSKKHQEELRRLGNDVEDEPLSSNVSLLEQTKQIMGMNTIIQNPMTDEVDFLFYFDRLSTLLVEK